jgi:hypothetical protein
MRAMRLNNGLSLCWLALALTLTPTLSLQMLKRNRAPECLNVSAVTVVIQCGLRVNGLMKWVRLTALTTAKWTAFKQFSGQPLGVDQCTVALFERRKNGK